MPKKNVTWAELMIEMMPFSKELVEWCESNPKFLSGLKFIYSDKFISLGGIITSYPPNGDEVIGIYTYDYRRKNPIFKQDFIVNRGRLNKEFILFTRNPEGSNKYVKDINDFYGLYGGGGSYVDAHHLRFEDLPEEIKPRALDAIKLAERIGAGVVRPSQGVIDKTYKEVLKVKKGRWFEKQKLWSIHFPTKLQHTP